MKKISFLTMALAASLQLLAQTPVGVPHKVGTGMNSFNWLRTNPADVQQVDGKYVESKTLRLTQANVVFSDFRLSVPSTATITGIEARIWRRKKGSTTVKDVTVALLKPINDTEAVGAGPNLASPDPWSDKVTEAFYSFPATGLLRPGEPPFQWMPADVNHPAFSLFLGASFGSGRGAAEQIDMVQITVLYTQGGALTRRMETRLPAVQVKQFGRRFRVQLPGEGEYRFTVHDRSGVLLQQTTIRGPEVMVPLDARCKGYLVVTVEGRSGTQSMQVFVQ